MDQNHTNGKQTEFSYQPLQLNCGELTCNDNGIFLGENMICTHPIMPVAKILNIHNNTMKVKLAYRIIQDWQYLEIPMSDLATPSRIISLANYGIKITSENAAQMMKYFFYMEEINFNILPIKTVGNKLGWNGEFFLPYERNIQLEDKGFESLMKAFIADGECSGWIDIVKKLRQSSTSLLARIVMAASFSSALIEKVNGIPFVVHIWGDTEIGKSVCLMLAISIWGDPNSELIQTFNSTDVGYELKANVLNSIPLAIDEFQILKGKASIERLVYMLCEGKGRSRGKKSGGLQELPTWRNTIITTGEYPISNESTCSGAVNRTIELTTRERIFENPHEIVKVISSNYGFGGRLFVEILKLEKKEKLIKRQEELFEKITKNKKISSKQALSASILLLADELAEEIFDDGVFLKIEDILPFLSTNETISQNRRCYEYLKDFVVINESKFIISSGLKDKKESVYGKMEGEKVFFFTNTLKTILEDEGYNLKSFLEWAKQHKCLIHEKNRNTIIKRISGQKPVRCYGITFDWEN